MKDTSKVLKYALIFGGVVIFLFALIFALVAG